MRDLGGYLAAATARPLVFLFYHRRAATPAGERWTAAEVRQLALRWPADGHQAAGANLVRTIAWFSVTAVALVSYVGLSWGLPATTPAESPVPAAVLTGLFALMVFGGGAGIGGSFRWTMCELLEERLDHRLSALVPRRRRGLLLRLCLPSHAELIVAALLSWSLTLAHYDDKFAPVGIG